jgi:hypothetical protein
MSIRSSVERGVEGKRKKRAWWEAEGKYMKMRWDEVRLSAYLALSNSGVSRPACNGEGVAFTVLHDLARSCTISVTYLHLQVKITTTSGN